MREDLRQFLIRQFGFFEGKDFDSRPQATEAILTFLSWVVPTIVFVYWSNTFYPTTEVLSKTVIEAFSPNLWNTFGVIGMFLSGVAIAFSTIPAFPRIANRVLHNAFSMGCLMWGVLVGRLILLPFEELEWWQQGIYGFTFAYFLIIALLYNTFLWYLGSLMQNKDGGTSNFIAKVRTKSGAWRAILGFLICSISFIALILS